MVGVIPVNSLFKSEVMIIQAFARSQKFLKL